VNPVGSLTPVIRRGGSNADLGGNLANCLKMEGPHSKAAHIVTAGRRSSCMRTTGQPSEN